MKSTKDFEENGTLKSEVLAALQNVITAEAYVEYIRPFNDKAFQEAFEKFKPVVVGSDSFLGSKRVRQDIGQPIASPGDLYRTDEETASKVLRYHQERLAELGFTEQNDNCPFLVAEDVLRKAKHVLVDVISPITGVKNDSLRTLEKREKYIELTLKFLVGYAHQNGLELNLFKPF